MAGLSKEAEQFIFEYIDSVSLLETLLLFHSRADSKWSANSLAAELRSNSTSTKSALEFLTYLGLIQEVSPNEFSYSQSPYQAIVDELAQAHKIRPHTVFELIFSPMKKARDFAAAFRRNGPPENKDDNDG